MAILTELRDPRIAHVTVTYVEVTPDMRTAKVHISVMADEAKTRLTMRGLESAAGFLQQKVSDRIDTRYTPRIQFVLDQGVKNSIAISKILAEVLPSEPRTTSEAQDVPEQGEEGGDEDQAENFPGSKSQTNSNVNQESEQE